MRSANPLIGVINRRPRRQLDDLCVRSDIFGTDVALSRGAFVVPRRRVFALGEEAEFTVSKLAARRVAKIRTSTVKLTFSTYVIYFQILLSSIFYSLTCNFTLHGVAARRISE